MRRTFNLQVVARQGLIYHGRCGQPKHVATGHSHSTSAGGSLQPRGIPRHMAACSSSAVPASTGVSQRKYATASEVADVAVVGGGIVGLATARELTKRYPEAKVVVLEKEDDIVKHQTSHNSGVIHAGIYYAPGSQMAKLCVEGAAKMYKYCEENNIPHRRVGKLIVATSEHQLAALDDLFQRATANGVQGLELLDSQQIKGLEPNISALRALHSPNTGIVDFAEVARSLAKDFAATGRGHVQTSFEVSRIDAAEPGQVKIFSRSGTTVAARHLITCAGLQADRVGQLAGGKKQPMVLPFRGTYHELKPEFRSIITRNIYPVPDPRFSMVGVHLTPRIDGRVLIGPNAALSMAKEGYSFWTFNILDMLRFASNFGLCRLVLGNFPVVAGEVFRDLSAKAFVGEARKYCPSLQVSHTTHGWAGVHAVAIDPQGGIVGEFLFEPGASGKVLNVRNAPSPACTSALAIAEAVVDRAADEFKWADHKL